MVPQSDEETDYGVESGDNFEESNYSNEASERRSKIRKLLKNHSSEKLSSESGAEAQMLQCYKDDSNLSIYIYIYNIYIYIYTIYIYIIYIYYI